MFEAQFKCTVRRWNKKKTAVVKEVSIEDRKLQYKESINKTDRSIEAYESNDRIYKAYRSSPCDRVNARLVYGRGKVYARLTRGTPRQQEDEVVVTQQSIVRNELGASSCERQHGLVGIKATGISVEATVITKEVCCANKRRT